MLHWITHNRLYDLARQGRRLTPWWALLPLAWLMLLLSQVFGLPVMFFLLARNGFAEGEDAAALAGQPVALAGLLQGLLLALAFGGMILLVWLWVRLYEKRGLVTLGFEREGALRQYGRGLLIGLLTFTGAVGLMALFGFLAPEASDPGRVGLAALGGILLMIPGWLVQGAAEEVLTRGWMMPALAARYRPWLGVLLSSLFFTAAHGLNPNLTALALINLSLYGLFAAFYALREGSLWGVCAFHSAWNWAQGNFFGLAVSGNQAQGGMLFDLMETGPDWFTGGAFGPEGGLAVTLVLLAGMAAMLAWPGRPASKR
ncbi:MAG: lysostaphin resistance A-like protein [Anaerolineae bacterium]